MRLRPRRNRPPPIVYPAGVSKEMGEDLSPSELVHTLKECAQAFQNMSQDEDNTDYLPLSLHFTSSFLMQHPSFEVRLISACCIADVLRIFAPEHPYKDPKILKSIFEYFIDILQERVSPSDGLFPRWLYLLKNLSHIGSFCLCFDLEDNQNLFCRLFSAMFDVSCDAQTQDVVNAIAHMLCPLAIREESSEELLETILIQIVEPRKSTNELACLLARYILQEGSSIFEQRLVAILNDDLTHNHGPRLIVDRRYDLIRELKDMFPQIVFPELSNLTRTFEDLGEKENQDIEDLSPSELVHKLKECAQAFQNLNQDEDNTDYLRFSLHFTSSFLMQHPSFEVRLISACCIADVLRIFAPEHPYKDPKILKSIFEYFIDILQERVSPSDGLFPRWLYLLKNLSHIGSFCLCFDLEDNQNLFCRLFSAMFDVSCDAQTQDVVNAIAHMLCPLAIREESSEELLGTILIQIVEPRKSTNEIAYRLARGILQEGSSIFEQRLAAILNDDLTHNHGPRLIVDRMFDLIRELKDMFPKIVFPALSRLTRTFEDFGEKENQDLANHLNLIFVTYFSGPSTHTDSLWGIYLNAFTPPSPVKKIYCIRFSAYILLLYPVLKDNVICHLEERQKDIEESVRYEVVTAIVTAAKRDSRVIDDRLLSILKKRALDKSFKIRKKSLLGLAYIYQQPKGRISDSIGETQFNSVIDTIICAYLRESLEDKMLVESILHICLVPNQNSLMDRMETFFHLFASMDIKAKKVFAKLLQSQSKVLDHFRGIVRNLRLPKSEGRSKTIDSILYPLSKLLQENDVRTREHLQAFVRSLENDNLLRGLLETAVMGKASCEDVEKSLKELMKSLELPEDCRMTIKKLLGRGAPAMIDKSGVKYMIKLVKNTLTLGDQAERSMTKKVSNETQCQRECPAQEAIDEEEVIASKTSKIKIQKNSAANYYQRALHGLQLIKILLAIYPGFFSGDDQWKDIISFLGIGNEETKDLALQILTRFAKSLQKRNVDIPTHHIPISFLKNFVETGTPRQAKHAVSCLTVFQLDKRAFFGEILERLKGNLKMSSPYFRTALVSVGHIAYHCHEFLGEEFKKSVLKNFISDVLNKDIGAPRIGKLLWEPYDQIREEAKIKIEVLKMLTRCLYFCKHSCTRVFNLHYSIIRLRGDLTLKRHLSPSERSRLRLTAASCLLKLCQNPMHKQSLSLEHFQHLALVLNDECAEVRSRFALKLRNKLLNLDLPIEFLAIFSLGALEKFPTLKSQMKGYIIDIIRRRNDYLKKTNITEGLELSSIFPDYVLPYVISLLAHHPFLITHDDTEALIIMKNCLEFLLEPLIVTYENYNFGFMAKILEIIKRSKNSQSPEDGESNLKLYAVCDLAKNILLSKTKEFDLESWPVPTELPSKLFTETSSIPNKENYLPEELMRSFCKKSSSNKTDSIKPSDTRNIKPQMEVSQEVSLFTSIESWDISDDYSNNYGQLSINHSEDINDISNLSPIRDEDIDDITNFSPLNNEDMDDLYNPSAFHCEVINDILNISPIPNEDIDDNRYHSCSDQTQDASSGAEVIESTRLQDSSSRRVHSKRKRSKENHEDTDASEQCLQTKDTIGLENQICSEVRTSKRLRKTPDLQKEM